MKLTKDVNTKVIYLNFGFHKVYKTLNTKHKKSEASKNRNFAFYSNYRIKYLLNNAPYHLYHLMVLNNVQYILVLSPF